MMASIARNLNFVGRADLLDKLSAKIKGSARSITAISGLGGLGYGGTYRVQVATSVNISIRKSELITELAHSLLLEPLDISIFWFDATTNDSLTAGFRDINQITNITHNSQEAITAAAILWLNSSVPTTRLLIIDNVDITSFASPVLESMLHPSRDRHVVFITRNRRLALDYAPPKHIIDMPGMSKVDAQQLLRSYIGSRIGDEEGVMSLLKKLEYHPLAIKCAGIYITSTGTTPTRFLELLEQEASFLPTLLTQTAVFRHLKGLPAEENDALYGLKTLVSCNEDVAAMIFLISCLNYVNLLDRIIAALAYNYSKREALGILVAYALIRPIETTTSWQMPELVRLTARYQLLHSPDRARYLAAALDFVTSLEGSPIEIGLDTKGTYAHVGSALKAVITSASEKELSSTTMKLAFRLSTRLCQFMVDQGRPYEAIETTSLLISWAPVSVANFMSTLDKLRSKLGVAYHGSGQFAVAESITREVLGSQIHKLGENDLDTLHTLNNMGVYNHEQGCFAEAEKHHRKVLEIKSDKFGLHSLEVFVTRNNLALSLQSQNYFAEAEEHFVKALRGRKAKLPHTHVDVLVSMSNLGVFEQSQGRYEKARKLHEAALKGREQALGPSHPETLKSKGNVALLLQRQGQYDESAELLRNVCRAYKAGLGPSHPDTIKSLRNLAYILHRQSNFAEAEILIREVLGILEEKHGKGHLKTFDTLQYLATLLHWQGNLEDALEMMAMLYDMQTVNLGKDNASTISSKKYLADLEMELEENGQGSMVFLSRM
jgi:tetratricopeptide (TPR) repeat protein